MTHIERIAGIIASKGKAVDSERVMLQMAAGLVHLDRMTVHEFYQAACMGIAVVEMADFVAGIKAKA